MLESMRALNHWLKEHEIDPDAVTVTLKFKNKGDEIRAGYAMARELDDLRMVKCTTVGPALAPMLSGIRVRFDA